MADTYCRLCLSREKLLDIFNPELTNSEQLRMCILMCTGVNILVDDRVTKYVCHTCCEIAIKLFKFRKNALANDRALKQSVLCQHETKPSTDLDHAVRINEFLIKKRGVRIRYGDELKKKLPTARRTKRCTVHPSVVRLVKCYPRIKFPNELITMNCDPKVYAENLDVSKLRRNVEEVKVPPVSNSDLDSFKQRFPGVSIVKLSGDSKVESVQCEEEDEKSEVVQQETAEDEKEECLKRKRLLDDEEKEVKKTKVESDVAVDLKIPEPTIKIKELLQDVVVDNDSGREATVDLTMQDEQVEVVNEAAEPENLEVSMLTANIQIESQIQTEELSQPQSKESEILSVSDTEDEGVGFQRKVLRPRKSRPSFFADEALFDDSDDDYVPEANEPEEEDDDENGGANCSLLQTFDEEMAFTCDVCNKMFDRANKLKLHRRMHKDCMVCKKTFISRQALNYHLNETCYKRIMANPPVLCLKKCDEEKPRETDFDVLCISDDDEPQPTVNPQAAGGVPMEQKEQQKVQQIFDKYNKKIPPYHKASSCQEDAQLYKAVMAKGQATMSNMYPILKYYRVPVIVHAADAMKVEMTDNVIKLVQTSGQLADWVGCPVKNLSNLVNAKTIGGRQIAPKPTAPVQQQEPTHPHSVMDIHEPPAGSAAAKLKQLHAQSNAPSTVATAPSLLLKNLQSEQLQNVPPIVLNNISPEQFLSILNSQSTKVSNTQKPPPQYAIQNQRPLPSVVPKTYAAKPHPQPVYQAIQARNLLPQIQNITQPQTVTIQQPPQAYIQTAGGYVVSKNQHTFTTPTFQSAFSSSIHPNIFGALTQTTINQNTMSYNQTFTTAKQAVLTGGNVPKGSSAIPLAPASVNTLVQKTPTKPPVQNNQVKTSSPKVLNAAQFRTILPQHNAVCTNQQQNTTQDISPPPPHQPVSVVVETPKPTQPSTVDSENSQNQSNQTSVITKQPNPETGGSYIRVKAPWELNGI